MVNDSVGVGAASLGGGVGSTAWEVLGPGGVAATLGASVGTTPHALNAAMIIIPQPTSQARRRVAGRTAPRSTSDSRHEPVGGPSSPDISALRALGLSHPGADATAHPHLRANTVWRTQPMSSVTSVSPRTLADVVPGGLVRSIALVIGGAIFVGLTAQVSLPLPFTPVPLTLQTFSVLLVGAALGSVRGAASMALYLLAGVAGVPWFAEQGSGWAFASFGYIVGFVAAAWLVGRLAERGADRKVLPTIGMMALGNVVIYVFGVAGLMVLVPTLTGKPMSLGTALAVGVLPFLIGDAIKILLAAGLLPGTWKLINSRRSS